jgi:putative NIF3 family GTP cyclohydrolase 1 type 2
MAKIQTARARVLSDNPSLGVKCGQIVEGPEKVIKALSAAGAVDAHPDAIAYAAEQGAAVVVLEDPAAAADLAAAVIESKDADASAADPIVAG